MTGPTYRLRTFGGLGIEPAHPALGQRRRLALLALLAGSGRAGLGRDRLASYLYPESDAGRARNALHQLVHGVRRELGEDVILTVGTEFRLGGSRLSTDIGEFGDALAAGELERAVALYTGIFLDGIHLCDTPEFERWCDDARRDLQTAYHDALDRLAQGALEASNANAAVRWTELRASSDPLSTRAALAYMRTLVAAGDRGAALKHARLHAALIRSELDAEPDAEFDRFVASIRSGTAPIGRPPIAPRADAPTAAAPAAAAPAAAVAHPGVPRLTGGRFRVVRVIALVTAVSILSLTLTVAWLRPASLTTGATTALTSGQAVELEPAISPDGKLVAFAAGPPGAMMTGAPTRVYVKQIAGGRQVALTGDSVVDQHSPRWSPDGTRIAFQDPLGISVTPALGGPVERLVADSGRGLSIGAWSPDGKRFSFSDERGVWVKDIASGAQHLLTTAGVRPHSTTWSPDGSLIAYVVGTGGAGNVAPSSIWLVGANGGTPQRVSDLAHFNTSPVFTVDGKSLLFVSNRDGLRDIYRQALRGMQASGTPTRLTTGTNAITISLSGDGERLAYGALLLRSNIWSAPIQSNAIATADVATPLTSGNQEIERLFVSPDGRWLLFDSNRSGNQDIYRMSVTGGDAVQLTHHSADDFAGPMSPDGREIVFYTFRDGGRRRVYTMRADGTAQMPVTDSVGQQRNPQWSADGNSIYFDSDRAGRREMFVVSRTAAGWGTPRLVPTPAGTGNSVLSPDGRYFALSRDSGIALVSNDGGSKVSWLVHTELRGPWRRGLALDVPTITWSALPSVVFFRSSSTAPPIEVQAVDLAGGRPRVVLRFDDPVHPIRRAEFATDGKRIYFTAASDEASAFLLELHR